MADFWWPRISPAGRVAGGSLTVSIAGGGVVAQNALGPQWAGERTLYYARNTTGVLYRAVERADGTWSESALTLRGVNQFTANEWGWGVSWVVAGQATVYWHNGTQQDGISSPTLSPSGQRAWLEHGTGRLFVDGVLIDGRACLEPRFTGEILAWRADDGRDVCVALTQGQIENRLNVESREFWPIAFVGPGGETWLLTHSDTRLLLRPVGSLTGYIVATGNTSYPDARFLDATTIKLAWTDAAGALTVAHVNTSTPRVNLRPGPVPNPMNPPGVTFVTNFPQTLSRTQSTTVRVNDRNNANTSVEVELIPRGPNEWSFHMRLTNPSGTDRSGSTRILRVPGPPPNPDPPNPPTPPTPGPSGPLQRVHADGKDLKNSDGQIVRIYGATLLSGLVRGDWDQKLGQLRDEGFNLVRVAAGALEWAGQRASDARNLLPSFIETAERFNLRVLVTAITDSKWDDYNLDEHVSAVGQICARYSGTILEIANEPYHPTQRDEVHSYARLQQLASLVPAELLVGLGASADDESQEPAPGEYFPVHLDRGRDMWNQVRRIREMEADEAGSNDPVIIQEAEKFRDPDWWFTFGFLARGFEIDALFHSDDGVQARVLSEGTLPAARAFLQGFRTVIPPDRDVTYFNSNVNGGWDQSPVGRHNVNQAVRCYSFCEGNSGHAIALGVTGDPGIVWANGWEPTLIYQSSNVLLWDIQRR